MSGYREAIAILGPTELAAGAAKIARRSMEGHGIPDGERMVVLREYGELLGALQRLQLSGAAGAAPSASTAAPDPTSEVETTGTARAGQGASAPGHVSASGPTSGADGPVSVSPGGGTDPLGGSAPDPKRPSGPTEQEAPPQPGRSGTGGPNQSKPGSEPAAPNADPATTPPESTAARSPGRRSSGGPNGEAGSGAKGARRDTSGAWGRQTKPEESHGSAVSQPTVGFSPVTLWAFKRGLKLSRVLKFLVTQHGKELPGISSTTDLYQVEGDQAQLAVGFLEDGFAAWDQQGLTSSPP